jgi:hypothetical protein
VNSYGKLPERDDRRIESLPQDGRNGVNPTAGVKAGWRSRFDAHRREVSYRFRAPGMKMSHFHVFLKFMEMALV